MDRKLDEKVNKLEGHMLNCIFSINLDHMTNGWFEGYFCESDKSLSLYEKSLKIARTVPLYEKGN